MVRPPYEYDTSYFKFCLPFFSKYGNMALTGPQFSAVADAFASAFDVDELNLMLQYKFGRDKGLAHFVDVRNPLPIVAADLVSSFDRRGEVGLLITLARSIKPNNPDIREAER